jgi:hypothetical protein
MTRKYLKRLGHKYEYLTILTINTNMDDGVMLTGLVWLRIGTGGELL